MMKANGRLALAVLVGAAIGILATTAILARQAKPAPGYVIAEIEVTDPAALQKYGAKVPETLAPFNHQYIIRGARAGPSKVNRPRASS